MNIIQGVFMTVLPNVPPLLLERPLPFPEKIIAVSMEAHPGTPI